MSMINFIRSFVASILAGLGVIGFLLFQGLPAEGRWILCLAILLHYGVLGGVIGLVPLHFSGFSSWVTGAIIGVFYNLPVSVILLVNDPWQGEPVNAVQTLLSGDLSSFFLNLIAGSLVGAICGAMKRRISLADSLSARPW